jgi:hypothetical protein
MLLSSKSNDRKGIIPHERQRERIRAVDADERYAAPAVTSKCRLGGSLRLEQHSTRRCCNSPGPG